MIFILNFYRGILYNFTLRHTMKSRNVNPSPLSNLLLILMHYFFKYFVYSPHNNNYYNYIIVELPHIFQVFNFNILHTEIMQFRCTANNPLYNIYMFYFIYGILNFSYIFTRDDFESATFRISVITIYRRCNIQASVYCYVVLVTYC